MELGELAERLKGGITIGASLSSYTSFGLGGWIGLLAEPEDEGDVENILEYARQEGMEVLVLGMGTNLLARDGGFPGVVIRCGLRFKGIHPTPDGIEVMAGTRGREVLDYCRENGLQGMEFATGIPGTIGGMVKTNAGAFGGEMGDIVQKIKGLSFDGSWRELGRDELRFAYRSSNLPKNFIITRVWLNLAKGKKWMIRKLMSRYLRLKSATQPLSEKSAGCIFKNPSQAPAAKLIEEVGGKGMRVGDAMVSPLHANFIINLGGATASQVLHLIDEIRERVKRAFGVDLELEVEVVGREK